jgi:signal transduction histidine kinase
LLGVVGSDVTLAELNDFLRTLKVGETGKSFIIERDGLLVASSSESLPFTPQSERIPATELEDALIRATAGYLQTGMPLAQIESARQLEFDFDGERQFLQITPWRDRHGLDWLIAVVIPEADFMAEIQANTRTTLALMLGALILTGLIGLLTARWVVHPILGLNQAAARLAGGDWGQHLPTERHDELGQLANTFNGMAQQLRELFQNLEQKVAERTHDLTIAYKRLKASQAQLVQSEKMASLGQMVAGVAHEINTPLGYVKSNVEMVQGLFDELEGVSSEASKLAQILVSGETDEAGLETQVGKVLELDQNLRESGTLEETRELFKDTLYGLAQIGELVTNLKNFSRLDQAHVDNVDIHDCLESSLNIAKNVLKHKVEVIREFSQVPKISCAPSQLNQVFLNLFTNAAQAIEDQGKLILKTSADQDYVHVSVQDTGKGISKEVLGKIFDPFFTTKPVGEGTGLGLSITFQIIRQHNGKIRVASEPGKGTRFLVSLPLKPAQGSGEAAV